jgi:hypothetical protein
VRISAAVADVAADLAALGALGDDTMAEAADRLAVAMQGPLTARLLELLGQAAAELQASEPLLRVEVRLVGDDAELVVVEREPQPEAGELEPDADTDARITLRLSATLKTRVEAASAREGVSVNTWIVRILGQQARSQGRSWGGRRLTGYGRS